MGLFYLSFQKRVLSPFSPTVNTPMIQQIKKELILPFVKRPLSPYLHTAVPCNGGARATHAEDAFRSRPDRIWKVAWHRSWKLNWRFICKPAWQRIWKLTWRRIQKLTWHRIQMTELIWHRIWGRPKIRFWNWPKMGSWLDVMSRGAGFTLWQPWQYELNW